MEAADKITKTRDNKNTRKVFISIALLLISWSARSFELDVGVGVGSRVTDNALQVVEDDDKITERQDLLGMNVNAEHTSEKINFRADYELLYTMFAKESQQDQETRAGQSTLLLGSESDIFKLELDHSVQLTLADPTDVQILENTDQRSITSVMPSINLRLTRVDNLVLLGSHRSVKYREDPLRDSEREGVTARWSHRINGVTEFGVDVSREDIKFEYFPLADYQVEYAQLTFSRSLRNLKYVVSVGRDQSITGNEEFDAGRYNFDLSYSFLPSELGVRFSKSLTDSSLGNANQTPISGDGELGGGFPEADKVVLSQSEIYATSQMLCATCNVSLSFRLAEEEYVTSTELNNESRGMAVGFHYRVSPRGNIEAGFDSAKRTFSVPEQDFKLVNINLGYRHNYSDNLDLNVYARTQTREYTELLDNEITENLIGFGLNYTFD